MGQGPGVRLERRARWPPLTTESRTTSWEVQNVWPFSDCGEIRIMDTLNIWSFMNFQWGSKHVRLMFGHLTFHQFSQRLEAGFELSAMTSWKSMTFVMVRSTGTSNYSSKFHEPRCWCPLECREPSAIAHDRTEECFARSPDLSTIVEKLWTHDHAVHLTFQQFYRS